MWPPYVILLRIIRLILAEIEKKARSLWRCEQISGQGRGGEVERLRKLRLTAAVIEGQLGGGGVDLVERTQG